MKCECGRDFKNKQSLNHHKQFCNGKADRCLFCQKIIEKFTGVFCSFRCQQDFYYKSKVIKWLNGELDGTKKYGHAGFIKRYLIEKFGNKCSICGWDKINPTTGNVPVELDHIDGNHKNNNPDNVRLLCPNCHSLTPTYKALNKGNGRTYRQTKPGSHSG